MSQLRSSIVTIVLVWTFLAVKLETGEALRCYVCTSMSDPNCENAPEKTNLINCDTSIPNPIPTQPTIPPATAPTTQSTTSPSTQPSTASSTQPSTAPSTQPSTAPSTPSSTTSTTQPSTAPSTQPSPAPSTQPSPAPSTPSSTTSTTQPSTASSTPSSTTSSTPSSTTLSPQPPVEPGERRRRSIIANLSPRDEEATTEDPQKGFACASGALQFNATLTVIARTCIPKSFTCETLNTTASGLLTDCHICDSDLCNGYIGNVASSNNGGIALLFALVAFVLASRN